MLDFKKHTVEDVSKSILLNIQIAVSFSKISLWTRKIKVMIQFRAV